MKFRCLFVAAIAVFSSALLMDSNIQGGDKPATIKEVMKKAHTAKKGEKTLLAKVTAGTADADEKKALIALYTDLAANKCPKGDETDWKDRTAAILKAAKADDAKALAKATNCAACHKEHK